MKNLMEKVTKLLVISLITLAFGLTLAGCPNTEDTVTPSTGGTATDTPTTVEYTVTFDADGGSPVPDAQIVSEGTKATEPATDPVKTDYTFLYWKTDSDTEFDFLNTNISEDITLTAYYVTQDTQTYTITVNIDPESAGTVTPDRSIFTEGESVTLEATANDGYEFDSWSGDVTGSEASLTVASITADMAITANFHEVYTITTSCDNATITLDPQKDVYETGDVVSVSIEPDSGYQFTGWTGALSSKNATETITVDTQDITIGAKIVERWLVLIHFAIDNNIDYDFEADNGIITNYLSTLQTVKAADTDDVMDILVLMDSYDTDDPDGAGYTSSFTDGYYEISDDTFANNIIKSTGEINSGSIQSSEDFIDWAYTNYSGKRVMYSVFNHGSGFDDLNEDATFGIGTLGIGFDSSDNYDSLSHNELNQVTEYLKTKAGKNIDIFYPYACLMGGMELAWEVKDNADYILFSEEAFPADYWSYEALDAIVQDPEITSAKLGQAFCDNAYDFFSAADSSFTLSLVDLSNIQPLYNALNTLATNMTNEIGTDETVASYFNSAALYGLYMYTPYYTDIAAFIDNVDLIFTDGYTTYTDPVRTALTNAVVYKKNFTTSVNNGTDYEGWYDNACGMTIFHNIWDAQYAGYSYNPTTYTSILTFGADNAWGDYVTALYNLMPPPATDLGADTYEPDDSIDTASELAIGSTSKQYHTLHYIDGDTEDLDYMKVSLTSGTTYTFITEAGDSSADTYLYLFDPDGSVIDQNDDIGSGNYYSKITYTATETGYYYLLVADYYSCYGDYNIYYDEGTFGPSYGATSLYNKLSPTNKTIESFIK
jgi:uncharacterized repeat protein (TIGR02543 family)